MPQSSSTTTATAEMPTSPPSAPLARRLAALAYDALLVAALLFLFTLGVILVRGGRAIDPDTLWYQASLVAVAFAFCGAFWTRGGQTLGMRAWQVRVIALDGRGLTWPRAALRFAASWVALLPAGLGYWWALADSERCCWHDRLSGTRVIRAPRRPNEPARA
jgi:uncharacterized RDD family membrane protein YckC